MRCLYLDAEDYAAGGNSCRANWTAGL